MTTVPSEVWAEVQGRASLGLDGTAEPVYYILGLSCLKTPSKGAQYLKYTFLLFPGLFPPLFLWMFAYGSK